MKSILENAEIMACYVEIDNYKFLIQNLSRELLKSQSLIEEKIDHVTGFKEVRLKNIKKEVIFYMEEIIRCKKIIEADCSSEEKVIQKLRRDL